MQATVGIKALLLCQLLHHFMAANPSDVPQSKVVGECPQDIPSGAGKEELDCRPIPHLLRITPSNGLTDNWSQK